MTTLDAMPSPIRPILSKIEELAGGFGSSAYLVGGVVRDRILGRPVLDLDLAIDGDAIAIARAAAAEVGAELRVHEEFGTAVLRLPSGRRIDLATTRSEHYETVAALPTVEPATLDVDLRRRDFTVNSMAQPLGAAEADRLIDPSEGLADLRSGLLRVHHERSFLDDPTRIVRGVRFEGRLALTLEPETERLAHAACAAGAVGRLSADRLRTEFELLFVEDLDLEAAWRRLGDLGVVEGAGLGDAATGARLLGRVERSLEGWLDRHGGDPPPRRVEALLAAALLALPPVERPAAADRLGASIGRLERIEVSGVALERPNLSEHEAADILSGFSPAELAVLEGSGGPEVGRRVKSFVSSQRDFELTINGAMLLEHGFAAGPAIGAALRATRAARLDGLITASEEFAFAIARLGGENRDR